MTEPELSTQDPLIAIRSTLNRKSRCPRRPCPWSLVLKPGCSLAHLAHLQLLGSILLPCHPDAPACSACPHFYTDMVLCSGSCGRHIYPLPHWLSSSANASLQPNGSAGNSADELWIRTSKESEMCISSRKSLRRMRSNFPELLPTRRATWTSPQLLQAPSLCRGGSNTYLPKRGQ